MKTIRLFLVTIILASLVHTLPMNAQSSQNISVKGTVKEAGTQTPIAYATIRLTDSKGCVAGSVSTDNGSFEVKTTEGYKKISISYVGYIKHTTELNQ